MERAHQSPGVCVRLPNGVCGHPFRKGLISFPSHDAVVSRRLVLNLLPRHLVGLAHGCQVGCLLGFLGCGFPLLGQLPHRVNQR
jgi:hypothetical protein